MVTKATRDVVDLKIRAITDGIDIDGDGGVNFTIDGTQIGVNSPAVADFTIVNIQDLTVTGQFDGSGATLIGTWQATYADIAEYYESDKNYAPGTVVALGGDKEITETTFVGDTEVFGIISTNPAFVLNFKKKGLYLPVALVGRVPCRVVGRVRKGQRLVASEIPGVARAIDMVPDGVIARSLENKDEEDERLIEVTVSSR